MSVTMLFSEGNEGNDLRVQAYTYDREERTYTIELLIWEDQEDPIYWLSLEEAILLRDRLTGAIEACKKATAEAAPSLKATLDTPGSDAPDGV